VFFYPKSLNFKLFISIPPSIYLRNSLSAAMNSNKMLLYITIVYKLHGEIISWSGIISKLHKENLLARFIYTLLF
jgi:hypothetical protein